MVKATDQGCKNITEVILKGCCLLGVVFQGVVVVIDADAEKQRAQTLHKPFIFPQVLRDLRRKLQESVKDAQRNGLQHNILCP